MTAHLLGIGTSLPPRSIAQADAAILAGQLRPQPERLMRLVPELYKRAGVQRRGSVLLGDQGQGFFRPSVGGCDLGPGTAARSDAYALHAPGLAHRAAAAALAESGVAPREVTHLVTVSCTGFAAPGVDAALLGSLGLPPTVQRTHVGFMGCHGAINGLRVAKAFCDSEPGAVVLLCAVELCSLHFQYTDEPDKMVANALFSDGAAAVVLSAASRAVPPRPPHSRSLLACASLFVPGSLDAMTWRIGDHGFAMTLSPRVPELIKSDLRAWLAAWLDSQGVPLDAVRSWAVHPGGPRVLTAAAEALGLSRDALDVSRAVLAEHGNMSSPTVLFILERLLRAGGATPCVLLAFGPGLVIEAALVG